MGFHKRQPKCDIPGHCQQERSAGDDKISIGGGTASRMRKDWQTPFWKPCRRYAEPCLSPIGLKTMVYVILKACLEVVNLREWLISASGRSERVVVIFLWFDHSERVSQIRIFINLLESTIFFPIIYSTKRVVQSLHAKCTYTFDKALYKTNLQLKDIQTDK